MAITRLWQSLLGLIGLAWLPSQETEAEHRARVFGQMTPKYRQRFAGDPRRHRIARWPIRLKKSA